MYTIVLTRNERNAEVTTTIQSMRHIFRTKHRTIETIDNIFSRLKPKHSLSIQGLRRGDIGYGRC